MTTTKLVKRSRAAEALRSAIDTFRQFVSPSSFREPGTAERTLIVPVADDGWAPALRCGEFAVIDTGDREPVEDAFFLRRGAGSGNLWIIQPRLARLSDGMQFAGLTDNPKFIADASGRGHWKGRFWRWRYGATNMYSLDGRVLSRGHSADGPMSDKNFRPEIVGRVIGVLGQPDRVLNWKDAA